jgi:hypothetical protein
MTHSASVAVAGAGVGGGRLICGFNSGFAALENSDVVGLSSLVQKAFVSLSSIHGIDIE